MEAFNNENETLSNILLSALIKLLLTFLILRAYFYFFPPVKEIKPDFDLIRKAAQQEERINFLTAKIEELETRNSENFFTK